MTTTQAIILGLVISLLIIGSLLGSFQKIAGAFRRSREERKFKQRSRIVYPLHLETDEHIHLYLKKNYRYFPGDAAWQSLLTELIRDLSAKGWNTNIPLRIAHEEDGWTVYITTDDTVLRNQLYGVVKKYWHRFEKL